MIPGGTDVVIETERPVELCELAVRWLFAQWKHALVCDANGEQKWVHDKFFEIPFGEHVELFVFPSKKHFDVSANTPDAINYINYIHLIREDDAVTVVIPVDSVEGQDLIGVLKNAKFPGLVA